MGIENNGGEDDKLKGDLARRHRALQEGKAKKFSGELKGSLLKEGGATEKSLVVGDVLINRDHDVSFPGKGEYVIQSATGEPGKRHFVLHNDQLNATLGKGEEALKDAIARGVWRRKE